MNWIDSLSTLTLSEDVEAIICCIVVLIALWIFSDRRKE